MDWLWKGKDDVIFETSRDRKRREKAKNIKWFVLAAAVLALIAALLVMKQYNFNLNGGSSSGDNSADVSQKTTVEEVRYATGKATFLVYCTGESGNDITFIYLIRADMDEDFIKVHPLPADENIFTYSGVNGDTLGNATQCYRAGGAGTLREACENYLGSKIDRYFSCNEENFENIVVNFTNVKINVPKTVNLQKNGDRETVYAGVQEISDRALYKYMTYDGFPSKQEKLSAQALSMQLIIDQFIDNNFIENAASVFSRIINLADSDISVIDLRNNMRALKFIANKNSDFECGYLLSKEEFADCITGG